MAVLVNDGAAPISIKDEEPEDCDSTRIAMASGALFVHVRLTCVDENAVPCRFVGAAGRAWGVVTGTSLEYGDNPAAVSTRIRYRYAVEEFRPESSNVVLVALV